MGPSSPDIFFLVRGGCEVVSGANVCLFPSQNFIHLIRRWRRHLVWSIGTVARPYQCSLSLVRPCIRMSSYGGCLDFLRFSTYCLISSQKRVYHVYLIIKHNLVVYGM